MTTPLIACDFIDSDGVRSTSFQLCRKAKTRDGLEAIAIVNFDNDRVTRCQKIHDIKASDTALIRLARRYQARSIPQRFTKGN